MLALGHTILLLFTLDSEHSQVRVCFLGHGKTGARLIGPVLNSETSGPRLESGSGTSFVLNVLVICKNVEVVD